MIEYNPEDYQNLARYYNYGTGAPMGGFNYRTGSTQGSFMGNTGGLVGGLTNMALQQPFQGLLGMGMDAMGAPDNTSFYLGPQVGQPDQYPAAAAGFLNKQVS